MQRYELMTIIDPAAAEKDIDTIQRSIEGVIEQRGGHIEQGGRPERVQLATPMRGQTEGYRAFSVVALPPEKVSELQQTLRHHEGLLRSMIMVVEEALAQKKSSTVRSTSRSDHAKGGDSKKGPSFSDEAIAREINAVIEREVEKVSEAEEKAHQEDAATPSTESVISKEEVQDIDDQLDKMLKE